MLKIAGDLHQLCELFQFATLIFPTVQAVLLFDDAWDPVACASGNLQKLADYLLLGVLQCTTPSIVVDGLQTVLAKFIAKAADLLLEKNAAADPEAVQASEAEIYACALLHSLIHQDKVCRQQVDAYPGLSDWRQKLSKPPCHMCCDVLTLLALALSAGFVSQSVATKLDASTKRALFVQSRRT